jgi:hypothetical protein
MKINKRSYKLTLAVKVVSMEGVIVKRSLQFKYIPLFLMNEINWKSL